MRISKSYLFVLLTVVGLNSCSKKIKNEPATADGLSNIETELKVKFGANAYYTQLSLSYHKTTGNQLEVVVSANPSSLEMDEWQHSDGSWVQDSEITIEIPENSEAKEFMFQINDEINLKKLGDLIEKSSHILKTKKGINAPTLNKAFVKFPKTGDHSKAGYCIILKPQNKEETFTFIYSLKGDLEKMES